MFGYLRIYLTIALLAGIGAGLVIWGAHMLGATPLILQAEVYENAEAPAAGETSVAGQAEATETQVESNDAQVWAPQDGWERSLYTLGADVLTGVAFALLLTAAIALFGKGADWRRGLLWGLAGFACVSLLPSFGLPPELPGAQAAPLGDRQIWWVGTAVAAAAGLFAAIRLRSIAGYAIAVVLIALPQVIGAPEPETPGGLAPEELQRKFVLVALASSLAFWLALGGLTGAIFKRYAFETKAAA